MVVCAVAKLPACTAKRVLGHFQKIRLITETEMAWISQMTKNLNSMRFTTYAMKVTLMMRIYWRENHSPWWTETTLRSATSRAPCRWILEGADSCHTSHKLWVIKTRLLLTARRMNNWINRCWKRCSWAQVESCWCTISQGQHQWTPRWMKISELLIIRESLWKCRLFNCFKQLITFTSLTLNQIPLHYQLQGEAFASASLLMSTRESGDD